MRETERSAPREDVIHRLERTVQREGFRTLRVGGEYSLLAQPTHQLQHHRRRARSDRDFYHHGVSLLWLVAGGGGHAANPVDYPGRSARIHGLPRYAARLHYVLRRKP